MLLGRNLRSSGARWMRCKELFATNKSNLFQQKSTDNSRSGEEAKEHSKNKEGADLLRSLNAYSFREHLAELSQRRMHMNILDLIRLAQQQGAAATEEEAKKLCDALVASGVLFRYRNVVYLACDDIADILRRSLPDTEQEYMEIIRKLEDELKPLEELKNQIEGRAHKNSIYVMWFGLGLLVSQLSLFIRLTYWDLSWDVVEPLGYFATLMNGILVYAYFLFSKQNFDFPEFQGRVINFFKRRQIQALDYDRYDRLKRQLERYRRYLAMHRI